MKIELLVSNIVIYGLYINDGIQTQKNTLTNCGKVWLEKN